MNAQEYTKNLRQIVKESGVPVRYQTYAYCELDDDQEAEPYEEVFSLYVGGEPYLQWRPYPEIEIALHALCKGIMVALNGKFHPSVRPFLDRELEDDDTPTGGTSFEGETVRDFIEETADAEDLNKVDLDVLNDTLRECGIRPVE